MRIVELGDSVELITKGTTPTSLGKDFTEDGVKFLRAQNVIEGKVLLNEDILHIDNETHSKELKRSQIKKGDVLLTIAGTIGRTAIVEYDLELNCNQAVAIIRLGSSDIDPRYLCHFISSSIAQSQFTKGQVTATISNLSLGQVNKLKVPLPPLETQYKIAAILDAADAHLQKTKALLEKYDQLAQSIFLEMFGDPVTNGRRWEVKKLEKICGVGSSRRVFVENLEAQGVPFFRGTEVGQLGAGQEITPSLFISEEHYERLKEQEGVPEIGDLLMPSICPDGRIWRVSNSDPFYFKDGRVLWIKVDGNRISSSYLRAFLKAIFAVNYEKIASGTTFAELKIVALKGIAVSIPPIELQNQFESRISQVELAKRNTQEAFNKSESLFQSLLQGAFKGELK